MSDKPQRHFRVEAVVHVVSYVTAEGAFDAATQLGDQIRAATAEIGQERTITDVHVKEIHPREGAAG